MPPSDWHAPAIERAVIRSAWPALWTMALLRAYPPPMKAHTPTTPSLPTTATSAEAPSRIDETSDTTAVTGK